MKHYLILSIVILTGCVSDKRKVEQQMEYTNFKEDYSPYLSEIRAVNKLLAKTIPEPPDTSIKTQLKPLVKSIAGRVGNIGLRMFKPDTIRAVVMDIHGGGWEMGMAEYDDVWNDEMARTCKVAVVSVDYHLATPENPFPVCINDCKVAAKWLVDNAMKEFGTDKLFISGGSAGGHLAAVTTLYIRDSLQAIDKVKGVNLMYGCFDLSRTPSNRMASDSAYLLSKGTLDYLYQEGVFRGWSQAQLQDPQYSPLYADLHKLPPAFFTVGTADPLVDDTFFMEARWRLRGNKTFLAVYPESPHAFNLLSTKMAAVANGKIFQWIIDLCKE